MGPTRSGRHARRLLGVTVAALLLTGCADQRIDDLERYAKDVLGREGSKIQELPPLEPYEVYTYASAGTQDPFEPFYKPEAQQQEAFGSAEGGGGGLQPDTTRNREELEQYALDSLRMMGTLELEDTLWGIIRSPDGTIHGKIVAIAEDRIEVNEIIPNGQNGWLERSAALALFE